MPIAMTRLLTRLQKMHRFSILMYHMISEPLSRNEEKYACPTERFRSHMRFLREKKYNIVTLDEIHDFITTGKSLPDKAVSITLDDGFKDNFDNAFPVLLEMDIPATIFLATGTLGNTNIWMENRGFSKRPMLTWDMVRSMNNSIITFGAHTVSHANLSKLDKNDAQKEVGESKRMIEHHLGVPVKYFAYPYGLFTGETPNIISDAGFKLACSTRSGFNNKDTNPFLLRRIEVYGNDSVWKLSQKLTYGMNDASIFFPIKYYYGRFKSRLGI